MTRTLFSCQEENELAEFIDTYFNGDLEIMFAELNYDFSNEEIKKTCSQLNNGRSGGPD